MFIHDVNEYIHRRMPRPQFYVQDILPKLGIMLLYGAAKAGKSWITQQMAFCIATGNDWLGFRTEQAKVLLIQFEMSPLGSHWRLTQMAQHFELSEGQMFEASPGLLYIDVDENFNMLSAAVRGVNPDVLMLDCMSGCFGGDENDSRSMAKFILNVTQLGVENEASIVLVHHSRKTPATTSFAEMARGQSRLAGWVDSLVYLAQQPGGKQLQFMARQATRELRNVNVVFNGTLWAVRE